MKTFVRLLLSLSAACLVTIAIGACALLQVLVEQPEVKLETVRIVDPQLQQATLMFDLSVMNPNSQALKIDGIDYKLNLNGKQFAEGVYDTVTELPSGKTIKVSLPIKVEYARVFDSLMSALQKPESKYLIEGAAKMGPFTIPFAKDGTIKW